MDAAYEAVQDAAVKFMAFAGENAKCKYVEKRKHCPRTYRRVEYMITSVFDKLTDLQFYRHVGRLWYDMKIDVPPSVETYI